MCKLIMIDDNPIEHTIVQKMTSPHGLFSEISYSLDGWLIIEFLKKNCTINAYFGDSAETDHLIPV